MFWRVKERVCRSSSTPTPFPILKPSTRIRRTCSSLWVLLRFFPTLSCIPHAFIRKFCLVYHWFKLCLLKLFILVVFISSILWNVIDVICVLCYASVSNLVDRQASYSQCDQNVVYCFHIYSACWCSLAQRNACASLFTACQQSWLFLDDAYPFPGIFPFF